jgi:hypothetical protein
MAAMKMSNVCHPGQPREQAPSAHSRGGKEARVRLRYPGHGGRKGKRTGVRVARVPNESECMVH